MPLGIGVITYARQPELMRTIERIQKHTKSPYYLLVAEDDSWPPITADWCRTNHITAVNGDNRGVCWNKNRALFTFIRHTDADPIILLEDDCYPITDGWEQDWIEAAKTFHHVNYVSPHWPPNWCRGGQGTAKDPWRSWEITGQATITTRAALLRVGYLSTTFRGYGYGHIDWTERFCKAGFIYRNTVPCLNLGLTMEDAVTFRNLHDVKRNHDLFQARQIRGFNFCDPWQTPEEMTTLIREVDFGLGCTPLVLRGV